VTVSFLHCDDDVVAVNKPEGMASIPEFSHDTSCLSWHVSEALGSAVWPVHRLDKDVSGVILYARHEAAHRFLNTLFERREARKTYLAVVHGSLLENEGVINKPIRVFGSGRMGVDPRGKPSVTTFRVVERFDPYAYVEVYPKTGRRHQIRVHFYSIAHPLVGDTRYGEIKRQRAYARLMLHASAIHLPLPSGQQLNVSNCPSATFDAELLRLRQLRAPAMA